MPLASSALDRPPLLRPGDRVRVVAPSGPVSPERLDKGVSWLRQAGFDPIFDQAVLTRTGFLAGDDDRRLQELTAALADDEVRAVWAARGGYGSTRLLPNLELDVIRQRAKWLVGFSDITALHGLWRRAGLCSLHAANVTALCEWGDDALGELAATLFEGCPAVLTGSEGLGGAKGIGQLAGGNLRVLGALLGTPFFPSLSGSVLLIEDVNEAPYKLDRLFVQLEHSGALDGVCGLAVGQLTRCGPDPADSLDVVREHARKLGVPTVLGLPVGHEPSSRAVLLGAVVTLDSERAELRYQG